MKSVSHFVRSHIISYLQNRIPVRAGVPFNYTKRDVAKIGADVDYSIDMANKIFSWVNRSSLAGDQNFSVLELGPDHNFGPALLLVSHGVKVTVADPFLVTWDKEYHSAFYKALAEKWAGKKSAIKAILAEGRHEAELTCLEAPVESMPSVPPVIFRLFYRMRFSNTLQTPF